MRVGDEKEEDEKSTKKPPFKEAKNHEMQFRLHRFDFFLWSLFNYIDHILWGWQSSSSERK